MELRSLSASSAEMFEKCEARWAAEYHGRAEQIGSAPALKGTVVHATLESWVRLEEHLGYSKEKDALAKLREIYTHEYEKLFSDTAEYDDGWQMVQRWYKRTDWTGRTILDLEVKKNFLIYYNETPNIRNYVPFNYIFDRVDRLDDGDIEVVDYKTWRIPLSPEILRHKIQPKAYALAASLEYPDANRIWVTMDQLRHEPIGVSYRKEDLDEFHTYLERLVERILASDGSLETLNDECRYCVRKLSCRALATNRDAGGTLGVLDNIERAAGLRQKIEWRYKGLEALLAEIDDFILKEMQRMDTTEWMGENLTVELKLGSRREINAERAAAVVGADIIAKYGKLNIGAIDKLLDSNEITPEQKQALKKLITKKWNAEPTPKIRKL